MLRSGNLNRFHARKSAHDLTSVVGVCVMAVVPEGPAATVFCCLSQTVPFVQCHFGPVPISCCNSSLHSPVPPSVLQPDIAITTGGKGNVVSVTN
jgi:hypothetical protein